MVKGYFWNRKNVHIVPDVQPMTPKWRQNDQFDKLEYFFKLNHLKRQFSPWMLLFTNIVILRSDWSIIKTTTNLVSPDFFKLYKNCYNALDYDYRTFIHRFSFFLAKVAFEIKYFNMKTKTKVCLHFQGKTVSLRHNIQAKSWGRLI